MNTHVRWSMLLALLVISIFGLMGMDLLESYEQAAPSQRETLLNMVAEADAQTLQSMFAAAESFSLTEEEADAAHEETLAIVGVYPTPSSTLREEIVFYFSEELAVVPEDADARPMLIVDPPIPGRIEVEKNTLRFVSPFLEALSTNANLNCILVQFHPGLHSVTGGRLPASARKHMFCLSAAALKAVTLDEVMENRVRLHLDFTRPVIHEDVAARLTVHDPMDRVVNDIKTEPLNNTGIYMEMPLGTALPLRLSIAEGLPWGSWPEYLSATPAPQEEDGAPVFHGCGDLPCTADAMEYVFPPRPFLAPPSVRYVIDNQPMVTLDFSEPVDMQQLRRLLELYRVDTDDRMPFKFQDMGATELRLRLDIAENQTPPKALRLYISPYLSSLQRNAVLVKAHEQQLTLETRSLALHYRYWIDNDISGYALNLSFNTQLQEEALRGHIEFIPPVKNIVISNRQYGGVTVRGDWRSETRYTMRLLAGLENVSGSITLDEDMVIALEPAPLREGAAFDSSNLIYFPRRDGAYPGLKARNITEAQVRVLQVFPSNIPIFVRDLAERGADNYLAQEYTREVGQVTTSFPAERDMLFTGAINLEAALPNAKKGVFMLDVEPAYSWQDKTRALLYTDIGALAHWTDNGLALFVHDLYTLGPFEQAKVSLYSAKYQLMGIVHTDPTGIARFTGFDEALGAPALAVIEKGDDYAFLDMRERQDSQTPFTASMPYYDEDGYDAYLYLDRSLYRPGETVHMRWIARTRYVDALSDVPLQLRVANPQGRWIHETPVTLSEFGTGYLAFQSERTHPTGNYAVELRVPEAAQPIGRASFNLEEFVPNRMKATATMEGDRLLPNDVAFVSVTAENLFGGVAAGRKTEARVFLRPVAYSSDAWPGYHFGNEDTLDEDLYPLGESLTDAEGRSMFEYAFAPGPSATMPLEAVAGVRVLEVGGRAVTDMATTRAFPDTIMLGITAAPRPEREVVEVHVAAVNSRDETPADLASVQLTLDRQQWDFHMRRFQDVNEPRWEKAFTTVRTYEVALTNGQGTLDLPYPDYGEYRLRVHSEQTRMYSAAMFNRWWNRLDVVSETRPELIRLTHEKEWYRIGDELDLRIESPYDGQAFIVIQGEEIQEQRVVPIIDGAGRARFVVAHDWFPNAWVQATVVRDTAQAQGARYPYSSFSMVNIPLDNPERRIETMFIDLPEEIRPSEPFTVTLATRDHENAPTAAEVTVAAVDEGIHSILGYDRPDPYSWFQRLRRFEPRRAHYYDKVFFTPDASAIGGDMMRRLGIASQVDENWIKPVALWSGVVRTDETGMAQLTFDVPEFIGQLRLTAVAVNERAVGAADARVYSRRPYILRTSMPRFAHAGDRFRCTAVAMNMTDAPVTALVRWESSGALSGGGETRLELAPHGQAACQAPIVAQVAPGQGGIAWTMRITAANDDAPIETIEETAPLPVGPPAAYQTETEFLTIMPGESRTLDNADFIVEPAFRATLRVTGDPLWQLRPGLSYLLQFPYGCVEQITSRAMPLFLLRNYARLYEDFFEENPDLSGTARTADSYIRNTVERLYAMQTMDGGLGTWPGALQAYPYGSVYALHFLTLARRDHAYDIARYEAPFRALQEYVLSIMCDDQGLTHSHYYLRAYACYVLALDGQLEALESISRFDAVEIPREARYLLAAAKAMHTQDMDAVMRYLEEAPMTLEWSRESSGTLHSPPRADAVRLLALINMGAPYDKTQPLVASLIQYVTSTTCFTTQEAGFVVTALGMYLEKFKDTPGDIGATITVADEAATLSGLDMFTRTLSGTAPAFEVTNTGAAPVFVQMEMSGIPTRPQNKPVSEGLFIERTWLHENGEKVTDNKFRHGDQYLVELRIRPTNKVEQLLITDMLPAGFEVANPRLDLDAQPALGDRSPESFITTPAYLEVRDDRVALAIDELRGSRYYFRYLVRAVTPGVFQAPALHGECMYLPTVRAVTTASEIIIE